MYLDSLLIFDPIIHRTTNTKLSDITGGYLLCTIASHVGGGTLSVFKEMTHSLGIVLPLLVYNIKLHGMRMCPQEVQPACQALSLFWGAGLGGGLQEGHHCISASDPFIYSCFSCFFFYKLLYYRQFTV